jgi:hypothetical protein
MRRFLFRASIALFVIAVVCAATLWWATQSAPGWYEPPDPADAEVAELADLVEFRVTEEAFKIRPEDEPWTLRVREEQINAWLAARLPVWFTDQTEEPWPDEIGTAQVHLVPTGVALALPIGPAEYRRVVVATVVPSIHRDGLRLQLRELSVGRIAVPGDPVQGLLDFVGEQVPQEDQGMWMGVVDLITGKRSIPPVLELSDGRQVELTSLECLRGAVDLTSTTGRPDHAAVASSPAEASVIDAR